MNKKIAFAVIGIIVVLAGAVVAYSTNVLPFNTTDTGNQTQTQSTPLEESALDKNQQQEVVLTPLQESLQESIEKLKSEGKPYPELSFNSTTKIPTEKEITESVQSNGSFEATIVATTVIEYDGPREAGKERWDDIIVETPGPPTRTAESNNTEVLVRGNLTQRVIDEHPEIYGEGEGQYQYGEEPRTFVIDEAMAITFVESNATEQLLHVTTPSTEPEIANITDSSNTVMGFSFVPKKIDYTVNPKIKVLFFTLAEAKAGFLLDMAFGLRLPVQVNVTHPESMVPGQNYVLDTSLIPLDFAAEDYERMGLPPEKGQEFFSRFEVFLGLKVWVIGIPVVNYAIDNKLDLGEECTRVKGFNCQNFVTPFGSDENGEPREFPIPELQLDPDDTGLEYTLLGIISIGVGLMIDPDFGSDKISAKWSAAGYASGDGEIIYSAPSPAKYPIGPVAAVSNFNNATFIAQSDNKSAVIALDNYKFHLNRQIFTIYGNLQLEFFGVDFAQTDYMKLMEFNFTRIFGERVFGQHSGVGAITTSIAVIDDGQRDGRMPVQGPITVETDSREYRLSKQQPFVEITVSGQVDKSILTSGSEDNNVVVDLYMPNGTLYQKVELPEGSTSLGTHGSGNFNHNGSGRYEFNFPLSYEGTPHLDPDSYNYHPPAPAGNWTVKATYGIGQVSAETTFEVNQEELICASILIAEIQTDKAVYSHGDNVTVSGTISRFLPDEDGLVEIVYSSSSNVDTYGWHDVEPEYDGCVIHFEYNITHVVDLGRWSVSALYGGEVAKTTFEVILPPNGGSETEPDYSTWDDNDTIVPDFRDGAICADYEVEEGDVLPEECIEQDNSTVVEEWECWDRWSEELQPGQIPECDKYFFEDSEQNETRVTIQTDKQVYNRGETVTISGWVDPSIVTDSQIQMGYFDSEPKRIGYLFAEIDDKGNFSNNELVVPDNPEIYPPGQWRVGITYEGHVANAYFEVVGDGFNMPTPVSYSGLKGGEVVYPEGVRVYHAGDNMTVYGWIDTSVYNNPYSNPVYITLFDPFDRRSATQGLELGENDTFEFKNAVYNVLGEWRVLVEYGPDYSVEHSFIVVDVECPRGMPIECAYQHAGPVPEDQSIHNISKIIDRIPEVRGPAVEDCLLSVYDSVVMLANLDNRTGIDYFDFMNRNAGSIYCRDTPGLGAGNALAYVRYVFPNTIQLNPSLLDRVDRPECEPEKNIDEFDGYYSHDNAIHIGGCGADWQNYIKDVKYLSGILIHEAIHTDQLDTGNGQEHFYQGSTESYGSKRAEWEAYQEMGKALMGLRYFTVEEYRDYLLFTYGWLYDRSMPAIEYERIFGEAPPVSTTSLTEQIPEERQQELEELIIDDIHLLEDDVQR